jgi:hypothetical protein
MYSIQYPPTIHLDTITIMIVSSPPVMQFFVTYYHSTDGTTIYILLLHLLITISQAYESQHLANILHQMSQQPTEPVI